MSKNKKIIACCAVVLAAMAVILVVQGRGPKKDEAVHTEVSGMAEEEDALRQSALPKSDKPQAVSPQAVSSQAAGTKSPKKEEGNSGKSNGNKTPGDGKERKEGDEKDEKGKKKESGTKNGEQENKEDTEGKKPSSVFAKTSKGGKEQKKASHSAKKHKKEQVGKPAAQTAGHASEQPSSEEKQPQPSADVTAEPQKNMCKITVTCEEVFSHMGQLSEQAKKVIPADGIILMGEYEIRQGDTVFDVLKRGCMEKGIHLDYSFTPIYDTYYIKGIHNLYEFDCGDESGWMYKVNDQNPGYGCSRYVVKPGDRIVFYYSCEY